MNSFENLFLFCIGFSWFLTIVTTIDHNIPIALPLLILSVLLTWAQIKYLEELNSTDED